MKIAVLYVGSSLLAPLKRAERDINDQYHLGLSVATHNCTLPLDGPQWVQIEQDLARAAVVFVIHVTDQENAGHIGRALDRFRDFHHAVIVINCLGDLMRRTRLGNFEFASLFATKENQLGHRVARKVASWMSVYAKRANHNGGRRGPEGYLKHIGQIPAILRFVPSVGKVGNIKHYLTLYCYFLQPTPTNIRSMLSYAIKHYVPGFEKRIKVEAPENRPMMGIYHPDAPSVIESFDEYRKWYERRPGGWRLDPHETIGVLLMRPQVVSGARQHYNDLIRSLEAERLPVIPVLSTLMDNRQACDAFFVNPGDGSSRISQLVSLTGFSFVGGPAMNDSEAAVGYLRSLNRPLRSSVSLEMQKIDDWSASMIGLNPVQTAMQVAIPEMDGATEPFIFGGLASGKDQPEAISARCRRIALRLKRWNRLRLLPPAEVRLAFLIYCFPPNKGNLGTAADLDVFPSLWEIFNKLSGDGYAVNVPDTPDALREMLLSSAEDQPATVAYRFPVDEYYRLCPYVQEIESEWGPAPGQINARGRDILIHGITLGNIFLGVQPTFGYEGDPMRLLMAKGGAPHHGFMGLYTYLDKIFRADGLVHVGTHGALEFMPGKQVGLSDRCWPDRLIGDLPNIYIYSVNNPSEGSIAKRRSYAELISYLTPPIENAGLYKELKSLKELLGAYRLTNDENEREQIFQAIDEKARSLNFQ